MNSSSYNIYNASAGSGKTYTLAKKYIKLLISSNNLDYYKSILGVTFTNKAVGEMKERIIKQLKIFSKYNASEKKDAMAEDICAELNISKENLQNKSSIVLNKILHNYGAFNITTIDGFTHKIIRTFANDLSLSPNFEVELDTDRALSEVVDKLISKAGIDKKLTKILIDFALEKANEDKSWDISFDFNTIAKLLINENDKASISTFSGKSLKEFSELKTFLINDINSLKSFITEISTNTINLISDNNIEFSDFDRQYLPKYFEKVSKNPLSATFGTVWQNKLIDGEKLYPKRVDLATASKIEEIQPKIKENFEQLKTSFFKLKLHLGFYNNFTPLSVISALLNELNTFKKEENKLLISDFNNIISQEIKNQPTPFIYERLGERFNTFFIDEFQDTSEMQWQNIVPLLENTLAAEGGSVMLVGDAKQAIYRWRGGVAEQFINLYENTQNPFQISPEVLKLESNFRSTESIVKFNNGFFSYLGKTYFDSDAYKNLYQNASQKTQITEKGSVNISFLEKTNENTLNEMYCKNVLEIINKSLKTGYNLSDICVLVRRKSEGVLLSEFLNENNINITSSETLLLYNSILVKLIFNYIKLIVQPKNQELLLELLISISQIQNIENKHLFFSEHLKSSLSETTISLKSIYPNLNHKNLLKLTLFEQVEYLINAFEFTNISDAYLIYFLDIVFEYCEKNGSNILGFIEYFELHKDRLSIVSPENQEAVEIMTIHKSKGLEFDIVIYPFADVDVYKDNRSKIWFPVDKENYNGFETLQINFNKDLELYNETSKAIYNDFRSKQILDNINVLYVALTRASKHLFILSKYTEKDDFSFSSMFINYLKHTNLWHGDQRIYEYGDFSKINTETPSKIKESKIAIKTNAELNKNFRLNTNNGSIWQTTKEHAIIYGNVIHDIFSKIKLEKDITSAFENISVSDLASLNIKDLKSKIQNVIQHPELNQYFNNNDTVYTEQEILTKSGNKLRPDRVNINSKNEAVIIDYKTGDFNEKYKEQLIDYELALNEMGYKVIRKLIIEVNKTIEVIEI